MMLCNITVPQNINEINKERTRPRIDISFDQNKASWLFDTGASRTCMPEKAFRRLFPPDKRPEPLPLNTLDRPLQDAGGNDLGFIGTFLLEFNIKGRKVKHEVAVLRKLTDSILGADFMHRHHLSYDAFTKKFFWGDEKLQWTNAIFSSAETTTIPALQTKVIKIDAINDQSQKCSQESEAIAFVSAHNPYITNQPGLIKFNAEGKSYIRIQNCAPFDITIPRNEKLGFLENCPDTSTIEPLDNKFLEKILSAVETNPHEKLTFEQRKTRIHNEANLNVPYEYRENYLSLLTKYSDLFSDTKYDLGRAKHFFHKIHLKDNEPVYRKQFKIPDAHKPFLEENITEWLKLGVIQRSQSLYNSPVFCVPKKDGGLRIVQDFRELNKHSYMDKYSMKEISECIGDIGKAKSTIFSTLDLTSGFWQMPLDENSRPATAFTIPGLGQFEWITSPMGLLGCPASFQRLMEMIFLHLKNVIVYIDDLLIHSRSHTQHLETLEETFKRLRKAGMKISLKKCFFGSKEVSYLGFRLTPEGIKPGKDKLKAIKNATLPKNVTEIKAFLGLCNFFRTHIKNFAQVASPLYILTRKDKNFKGIYTDEEKAAFENLKNYLCSEPVMSYPRSDRTFALLVDAATGTSEKPGGIGAILTQIDEKGGFHAISYASRQLVTHEKNYSPFLLEMQGAVWGMEYFQEHLRGKRFILFTDHKPLEALSHIHTKTLNRLQLAMMDFDFEIQYKKGIEMPADYLSRTPVEALSAINVFNEDLPSLQRNCKQTNDIIILLKNPNTKPSARTQQQAESCFMDQGILWKKLKPTSSWDTTHKTVLFVPTTLRRRIICEAHGKLLVGHNGIEKTKERILSTYYWPNMDLDIHEHIKNCLNCQLKDKNKKKPSPLQSLPTCSAPNQRVHLDLFGTIKSSSNKNNYILCMTDAFSKYAEVVAIPNKEAETVAMEFFEKWICRYGVPSQIHTDGGKEFVNKLSKELCEKLEITHSKNTPYHPQCNAQVEVFNKTVQKYLASVVNPSTLDWELYLAPLMFSYNTSFHATTKSTPFLLTFGMEPRLPSFPAPELQRIHYGESFVQQRLQTLQRARQIATDNIIKSGEKSEQNFNKKTLTITYEKGNKILLNNPVFTNKNKKLTDKWIGPFEITKLISDKTVELQMQKKKLVVNIDRIKPFNWKFHQPDTDEELFDNLQQESEDPKISIEQDHENLDNDDLVKLDKMVIGEEERPAWHSKMQKFAKAKYDRKQNKHFHQNSKQLAQQKFNENLINRRVTRSMTREENFNQQQQNLIKIEAIDINENSIKILKPILIKAMYKQLHSIALTHQEHNLLELPIPIKNRILQRKEDTPFDIVEFFQQSSINLPAQTFQAEDLQPPPIQQQPSEGYHTAGPATDPDSDTETPEESTTEASQQSTDTETEIDQPTEETETSIDEPFSDANSDQSDPDLTISSPQPSTSHQVQKPILIETEKSKNSDQKSFKTLAEAANYTTPPTSIKIFKQQFNNLRQPNYDSDSDADIFGTPVSRNSSNSSCSSYIDHNDEELIRVLEINKAQEKLQKHLKKEEKERLKAEQKAYEQTLSKQELIAFKYYRDEEAKEAKKLAALQKKTQDSLPGIFGKFQTEKQIVLQPDKVTTRAGQQAFRLAQAKLKSPWGFKPKEPPASE